MKADIDGGTVEGRVAVSHRQGDSGSLIGADLKAERLDLDAAAAVVRTLAGPQGEWPDEWLVSLDIGRAIWAGQELRPLLAKFGCSPRRISLDQLQIGEPDGVTLGGTGDFDRVNATGKLAVNSKAASLGKLTGLIAPFAPTLAARLDAMGTPAGPAVLKLALDVAKSAGQADRAQARAVVDLDAPQFEGTAIVTAKPAVAAINDLDIAALRRSELGIESKLYSGQGRGLLALLGLDRAVTAGDGPAQFEGTATGACQSDSGVGDSPKARASLAIVRSGAPSGNRSTIRH